MKYAILFAFAAFAFLAQADAKALPNDASLDRGAMADALKEKLTAAKEKLDEMISQTQDALKDKVTEAKKKAEELIDQLEQKAHEISDKVFQAAQDILDKLDASVNASLSSELENIEDMSECMLMKETLRLAGLSLIANVSSCITDKIEEAESYVMDIYILTTQAIEKIKEIKEEGDQCLKNVYGIPEISKSIACITEVTAKASWVIGKRIPAITWDIAKLTKMIVSLKESLPSCMSEKAVLTLVGEAKDVFVSVKDCIKEKIDESQGKSKLEQITLVESDNEVIDKHPQVLQSYSGNKHGLVKIQ